MIGVTGTQGKTTTTRLPRAGCSGPACPAAVIGTVGTRVAGEDVKTRADHARGAGPARAVRGDARARGRGLRDGGLQPRAGAWAGSTASSSTSRSSSTSAATTSTSTPTSRTTSRPRRRCSPPSGPGSGWSTSTTSTAGGCVERGDDPGAHLLDAAGADADWRAVDVELSADGSRVRRRRHRTAGGSPAGCPLPGDFNVANALAAVAACAEAGFDAGAGRGRASPTAAACRAGCERVDAGQDFVVVVDYAHKPDAVAAALRTLRPLTDGRLIVVIGAGGDRDPGKRPMMGEIAARLADVLVVTDDNPRTEDPAAIRAAMLAGSRPAAAPRCVEIGDRRGGDPRGAAPRPARRHRAGRRQGTRDRPGDRRRGASVRRPGGRPRGAGPRR